jgi:hypothetical protein
VEDVINGVILALEDRRVPQMRKSSMVGTILALEDRRVPQLRKSSMVSFKLWKIGEFHR